MALGATVSSKGVQHKEAKSNMNPRNRLLLNLVIPSDEAWLPQGHAEAEASKAQQREPSKGMGCSTDKG